MWSVAMTVPSGLHSGQPTRGSAAVSSVRAVAVGMKVKCVKDAGMSVHWGVPAMVGGGLWADRVEVERDEEC